MAKPKIEDLNERIRKIENIIDKLQVAIIEKVGSYQDTLGSIKKEMSMMQDSIGKIADHKTRMHEEKKTKK